MEEWAGVAGVAGWERFPWLRAGFSTRLGGVSEVYGDGQLNLGWTAEDLDAHVAENRRRLVEKVGSGGFELVTVRQVHGVVVQEIGGGRLASCEPGSENPDPGHPDSGLDLRQLRTAEGRAVLVGDGMMTDQPGVMLGIQTADCVPVLVADVRQRVVAAFHAGWRGTVAGIVEQGVAGMRSRYGATAEDLVAAVGPSIGPCCFEVGDEVREAFEQGFGYGRELCSVVEGRTRVDLWEANRRQLLASGVGDVTVLGECSACARVEGARKYFSHRAEKGVTGRMMGVIGVAEG